MYYQMIIEGLPLSFNVDSFKRAHPTVLSNVICNVPKVGQLTGLLYTTDLKFTLKLIQETVNKLADNISSYTIKVKPVGITLAIQKEMRSIVSIEGWEDK